MLGLSSPAAANMSMTRSLMTAFDKICLTAASISSLLFLADSPVFLMMAALTAWKKPMSFRFSIASGRGIEKLTHLH
jgi:hypothetical protein